LLQTQRQPLIAACQGQSGKRMHSRN
jgi:hypothetical protein